MEKLKASFDEPEHGWLGLTLAQGDWSNSVNISHIFDPIPALVSALHEVLETRGKYEVVLFLEPERLFLVFEHQSDEICLSVKFRYYRRLEVTEDWLSIRGSYEEICLPFWRALKELRGRYSPQEFERLWHHPFPARELDLLTQALGK